MTIGSSSSNQGLTVYGGIVAQRSGAGSNGFVTSINGDTQNREEIIPGRGFYTGAGSSAPVRFVDESNNGTFGSLNINSDITQTPNDTSAWSDSLTGFTATSTKVLNKMTLRKAVTARRLQVHLETAPSGCSINAVARVTDGTTPVNLTLSSGDNDSGAISTNWSTGATLTMQVSTAASGCTTNPVGPHFTLQYKMQ